MIIDYIKAYCKAHKIATYTLKNKVYTLDDVSGVKSYTPAIAFFYKLRASGIINNISDLTNSFLTANATDNFIDFAKVSVIKDFNSLQVVESDFVFDCNNMITFALNTGANSLFNQLFSLQLHYLVLTPQSYESEQNEFKTKINDNNNNDLLKVNIIS
jgi:hypothetical protein